MFTTPDLVISKGVKDAKYVGNAKHTQNQKKKYLNMLKKYIPV